MNDAGPRPLGNIPDTLPIGYIVQNRALVVDDPGASLVRRIFRRYLELRSVSALAEQLRRENIRSPERISATGRVSGNRPLTRGNLYSVLSNRTYIGFAVHKGVAYPGLHQPIIERDLWDRVQSVLADNRVQTKKQARAKDPSLLSGLVFDDKGERLTPSHATKNGRRFHYYVSRSLITQGRHAAGPRWRFPAAEVDTVVIGAVRTVLADQTKLLDTLELADLAPAQIAATLASSLEIAQRLSTTKRQEGRDFVRLLVSRITIADASVTIDVSIKGLREVLGLPIASPEAGPISIELPMRFTKRRVEQKIVLGNQNERPPLRNDALVKAIARAHHWFEDLKHQRFRDLAEIARNEGLPKTYVHALIPLAFLAPSIVTAILKGTQPPDLTLQRLFLRTNLALDWRTQRRQLGFEL
jgi:site-specific DNA recombinase